MTGDAMKQAWMTASDYALHTLDGLCRALDVDQKQNGWQEKLAPFAPVWAAMIKAAAVDFQTAVTNGAVEVHR